MSASSNVSRSNSGVEAASAAASETDFRDTFSFSAAGWLQMYHFGVCKALQDAGIGAYGQIKFAGSSAGALAATAMIAGCDFEEVRAYSLEACRDARRSWANGLKIRKYVSTGVRKFATEPFEKDVETLRARMEDQLEIYVTVLPWVRAKKMSDFHDVSDLEEALIASCCVTPLAGMPFPLRKTGEIVIDGGLAAFQPRAGEPNVITVSPMYFSRVDIRPSVYIPALWGLYPPDEETYDKIFDVGYNDCLHFMVKSKRLPRRALALLKNLDLPSTFHADPFAPMPKQLAPPAQTPPPSSPPAESPKNAAANKAASSSAETSTRSSSPRVREEQDALNGGNDNNGGEGGGGNRPPLQRFAAAGKILALAALRAPIAVATFSAVRSYRLCRVLARAVFDFSLLLLFFIIVRLGALALIYCEMFIATWVAFAIAMLQYVPVLGRRLRHRNYYQVNSASSSSAYASYPYMAADVGGSSAVSSIAPSALLVPSGVRKFLFPGESTDEDEGDFDRGSHCGDDDDNGAAADRSIAAVVGRGASAAAQRRAHRIHDNATAARRVDSFLGNSNGDAHDDDEYLGETVVDYVRQQRIRMRERARQQRAAQKQRRQLLSQAAAAASASAGGGGESGSDFGGLLSDYDLLPFGSDSNTGAIHVNGSDGVSRRRSVISRQQQKQLLSQQIRSTTTNNIFSPVEPRIVPLAEAAAAAASAATKRGGDKGGSSSDTHKEGGDEGFRSLFSVPFHGSGDESGKDRRTNASPAKQQQHQQQQLVVLQQRRPTRRDTNRYTAVLGLILSRAMAMKASSAAGDEAEARLFSGLVGTLRVVVADALGYRSAKTNAKKGPLLSVFSGKSSSSPTTPLLSGATKLDCVEGPEELPPTTDAPHQQQQKQNQAKPQWFTLQEEFQRVLLPFGEEDGSSSTPAATEEEVAARRVLRMLMANSAASSSSVPPTATAATAKEPTEVADDQQHRALASSPSPALVGVDSEADALLLATRRLSQRACAQLGMQVAADDALCGLLWRALTSSAEKEEEESSAMAAFIATALCADGGPQTADIEGGSKLIASDSPSASFAPSSSVVGPFALATLLFRTPDAFGLVFAANLETHRMPWVEAFKAVTCVVPAAAAAAPSQTIGDGGETTAAALSLQQLARQRSGALQRSNSSNVVDGGRQQQSSNSGGRGRTIGSKSAKVDSQGGTRTRGGAQQRGGGEKNGRPPKPYIYRYREAWRTWYESVRNLVSFRVLVHLLLGVGGEAGGASAGGSASTKASHSAAKTNKKKKKNGQKQTAKPINSLDDEGDSDDAKEGKVGGGVAAMMNRINVRRLYARSMLYRLLKPHLVRRGGVGAGSGSDSDSLSDDE